MSEFRRHGLLGLALLVVALVLRGAAPLCAQNPDGESSAPDPLAPAQSDDGSSDSAGTSTTTSPSGGGILGPDYVIGPEDVLAIDVFNVSELKQTVRVENDGMISVRLLGRVKAAGLTARQLKQELEKDWGESYLQNPQVSIFVREYHAQPVSVIGAVQKPGLYSLPGSRTLVEVLSMAGGLPKRNEGFPGKYLYVTRKSGFEGLEPIPGMRQLSPHMIEIELRPLLYSHEESLNIPIKPFDIVSVSKADVVYVVGEVKKPGGFALEDHDTISVLQALSLAEGLGPNPAKRATRIIHRADDGTLTEKRIDIGKILDGKESDFEMAGNDVLFIPSSHSKYATKRAAETVAGTLSGLVVFGGL